MNVWTREIGTDGGPQATGLTAYYVAVAADDPDWSKASIERLKRALDEDPVAPRRARATLGAAHRITARNFSILGAANCLFFGVTNFMRMMNIRSSFAPLDRVVDGAPDNPLVWLYRESSLVGAPAFFGGRGKGIEDDAQLERRMASPASNPVRASLFESAVWRDEYHCTRARSMEELSDEDAASEA